MRVNMRMIVFLMQRMPVINVVSVSKMSVDMSVKGRVVSLVMVSSTEVEFIL